MTPYYQDEAVTIYHGDCRDILPMLEAEVLITDPPYGIGYVSGKEGDLPRSIKGDQDTTLRDEILRMWLPKPAAVFATWRCTPPHWPRGALVWHKNVGGMGDLSFPWRPDFEMIWIYGEGWEGHRGSSVLRGATIPTWNSGPARRLHPHEKPADLIGQLLEKAPEGTIIDPFMGSGSTLRAAKDMHRTAIGIEIEERYCEVAATRMTQEVLGI